MFSLRHTTLFIETTKVFKNRSGTKEFKTKVK